jgi:hypothetical protein
MRAVGRPSLDNAEPGVPNVGPDRSMPLAPPTAGCGTPFCATSSALPRPDKLRATPARCSSWLAARARAEGTDHPVLLHLLTTEGVPR